MMEGSRKKVVWSVAFILVAAAAVVLAQSEEGAVAYRQRIMSANGASMGAINDILKFKLPVSNEHIAAHAETIHRESQLLADAFKAQVTAGETRALPEMDFLRAMTEGIGPDGTIFYPVFPYTAFTKMTRQDVLDLKAYLFSVPAVKQENKPPELGFPFNIRSGLHAWRLLNFDSGTFEPDGDQSEEWNRGVYLSMALAHCGECHTPRGTTGALDEEMPYAGSREGPESELAPNITPDQETGIGGWSLADIVWFLQTGFKPEGDDAQGLMGEVIEHGYMHLVESDLQAIAAYLKSLTPIRNVVEPSAQ